MRVFVTGATGSIGSAADIRIPGEGRRRQEEAAGFEPGSPHDFLRDNAPRLWGEQMARFDPRTP